MFRIAMVHPTMAVVDMREAGSDLGMATFFRELRRLGYVEGQNLVVERFSGGGRIERDARIVQDAVAAKPDLIVAVTTRILLTLKGATSSIPVVGVGGDPVALGLVANLARPGGNITGVSVDAGLGITAKRLEMLKQAVPGASRVALVVPRPVWEGATLAQYMTALRRDAEQAGITLVGAPVGSPADEDEYRRVFAALGEKSVHAMVIESFPENFTHRKLIVELAAAARLPAIYPYSDVVPLGGLLAYSLDPTETSRHLAGQVDRILKGARPGDIAFHQPTRFTLAINLRTAKALGLALPPTLLVRADEVID
ncbi:MAG: ABC transporter substrate-binding protein [Burkholderiales bacterium]|nr:ABC transporter substrate-binding protein [Burkholderiales bacterium]